MNTRRQRRGMTLMEVMIVIAIIALLTGALTMGLSTSFRMAKRSSAEIQASRLAQTAESYHLTRGKPLTALSQISEQEPLDPWGTPYELEPSEAVVSFAEDGRRGGADYDEDIIAPIASR